MECGRALLFLTEMMLIQLRSDQITLKTSSHQNAASERRTELNSAFYNLEKS